MAADAIIARLGRQPHPEGGHCREMFRAPDSPRGVGQAARSLGRWTVVGCIVAPAFRFEGFELAP